MKTINDKLFLMMGLMIVSPFLFGLILPEPYFTVATLGTNLVMLVYLRKSLKNLAGSLFGGKMKYQCLICQGTKFDRLGACYRCGSKSKKPI